MCFGHGEGDHSAVDGWGVLAVGGQDRVGMPGALPGGGHGVDGVGCDGQDGVPSPGPVAADLTLVQTALPL